MSSVKPPGEWADKTRMLFVAFCIFALSSFLDRNFLTPTNMFTLFQSVTLTGMVACTMLFCLASGDFDLSVGSTMALSCVVSAITVNATQSLFLAILAGAAAGAGVGLVNGIVIARLGINALITTLATMQIVKGLAYVITDGQTFGVTHQEFKLLGNYELFWIPTSIWITGVCFVIFGFLMGRTIFGRNTLAIGGNAEAARMAGIQVTRTKIVIFTLQGVMAGLAGVVYASRFEYGSPEPLPLFELQVISICVLGGVSLTGGIGSIWFVLAGLMILGMIENMMDLLGVPTFYRNVARGGILLGAVLFDRFKQRKSTGG